MQKKKLSAMNLKKKIVREMSLKVIKCKNSGVYRKNYFSFCFTLFRAPRGLKKVKPKSKNRPKVPHIILKQRA